MLVLRSLRVLLAATAATAVCVPDSSDGCEFLRRLFGGGEQTTYMPVVVPTCNPCSSCSSCAAPAVSYYSAPGCATCTSTAVPVTAGYTAYYVPQTYYRPVVQNVAVTAYRPAAAYNPYTGSIQTVYRPVTTYRPQWTYSPYTSYRIGYAPTAYYPMYPSVVAPVVSGCAGCSTPAMGTTITSELAPIPSASVSGWSDAAASSGASVPQSSTGSSLQSQQDPQSNVSPSLQGTPSKQPLPRDDDRGTTPPYGSGGTGSGNGAPQQPSRPSSTTGSPSRLISPPAERSTFRAQLPKIGFSPEAAPHVMLASRQAAAESSPAVRTVSADGWEAAD